MSAAAALRPVDKAQPANPVAVRMVGVRKSFGERIALDGADLSVVWGEVHALLGENGAGKSSLMNILAGFYGADGGVVEVAGRRGGAGLGGRHRHDPPA
jgi:ABC-type sugar transport system ATPase subunit